jgi:hypothetical protein
MPRGRSTRKRMRAPPVDGGRVRGRLEKIREISCINFEDSDELLHVHLFLKMLDAF